MAPITAFGDFGKGSKDILANFQFDQKLTLNSKTADGVALAFAAVNAGNKANVSLKTTYAYQRYALTGTFTTSDQVAVSASVDRLAPGLKATLTATLPELSSGKVALDYLNPYVTAKATLGLTSAPKVNLAAASAFKTLVYGGDVTFDTAKSTVTGYTAGVSLTRDDSQVAALVSDMGETLKLSFCHRINVDKSVAAEITRPLLSGAAADTAVTLGYQHRLENKALFKAKVDSKGILSALYEQRLSTGELLVLSTQLDTLKPEKAPKVGVSFAL